MNYDQVKCNEILNLEKIYILNQEKAECKFGEMYSLGLVSSPYFITVSSQQNRAETLATCINEKIKKRYGSLKKMRKVNIVVVGGGFSGVSFTLKMASFKNKNIKYNINLLEKNNQFCHLQSMCTTRRLHPNVHLWPKAKWDVPNRMSKKKKTQSEIDWVADTAGRVAKKFRDQLYSYNPDPNDIQRYRRCNNLVFKGSTNRFNFSFSAYRESDEMTSSFYVNDVDVVVIASGFGIERTIVGVGKNQDIVRQNSYWRNDSFGQTNLHQESELYLISGGGDGGLVDLFRLVIEDYNQDETLSELIPLGLYGSGLNPMKKRQLEEFASLIKAKGDQARDGDFELFYALEKFFKRNKVVYQYIADLFTQKVKPDVRVVLHVRSSKSNRKNNKLEKIVNNINVTFYNRVLFYFVYAFANVEVVCSDELFGVGFDNFKESDDSVILNIIQKYNIPYRNVVIRHGVDRLKPVMGLMSDSGYLMKNVEERMDYSVLENKYRAGQITREDLS